MAMEPLPLSRAFTLIEPGPVVLVTTHDGRRDNVMTITWSMVLDFAPVFAIATGRGTIPLPRCATGGNACFRSPRWI
jgi:flavin reductase (DIM6/NTAB) family NADH-FMN oxidoreductase RutF